MITQIFNLSFKDVFDFYSQKYKIFRERYSKDLLGMELRDLIPEEVNILSNAILDAREICDKIIEETAGSIFITGSLETFRKVAKVLMSKVNEELGHQVNSSIISYEKYDSNSLQISGKTFNLSEVYILGILNVTPDSFSDDGIYFDVNTAIQHGVKMVESGFDIIDIGGETTKPGANPVSSEEELKRIIPVINGIKERCPEAIISVDTYKSNTADKALGAGAAIVNDISGFLFDEKMIEVVLKHDAAAIIMHIKGTPKDMQINPEYFNLIEEIYDRLYLQVHKAKKAGVKNLIIDPGIGFGKRPGDNVEIIKRLSDFKSIGAPVLIGLSRKSFLKNYYKMEPEDKDFATSLLESASVLNGARFIRTHNIENGIKVRKILNSLIHV